MSQSSWPELHPWLKLPNRIRVAAIIAVAWSGYGPLTRRGADTGDMVWVLLLHLVLIVWLLGLGCWRGLASRFWVYWKSPLGWPYAWLNPPEATQEKEQRKGGSLPDYVASPAGVQCLWLAPDHYAEQPRRPLKPIRVKGPITWGANAIWEEHNN